MGIPTQEQYERNERMSAHNHLQEIERAPLSDRKEAQRDFARVMGEDPALLAERLGWLIDGNYGYGEMGMAKQIVAHPRMNREAALTQLVGAFEWQCPQRMTADAWKKLTSDQKAVLSAAVDVVIKAAEKEMRENGEWDKYK